jgi:hypothetical protein
MRTICRTQANEMVFSMSARNPSIVTIIFLCCYKYRCLFDIVTMLRAGCPRNRGSIPLKQEFSLLQSFQTYSWTRLIHLFNNSSCRGRKGRECKCIESFGIESGGQRDRLEDPYIDRREIL